MRCSQCLRNVEPGGVAQTNVEHDSIGQEPPGCLFGVGRAAGFTDDEISPAFEQFTRNLPEDRLIVDHQDAYGRRQGGQSEADGWDRTDPTMSLLPQDDK
jgi:hypothetical protein